MTTIIYICLAVLAGSLLAEIVVLTIHFQERREAYWKERTRQLADVLAEKKFRALAVEEQLNAFRQQYSYRSMPLLDSRGRVSGLIEVQGEIDSAEWEKAKS